MQSVGVCAVHVFSICLTLYFFFSARTSNVNLKRAAKPPEGDTWFAQEQTSSVLELNILHRPVYIFNF